MSLNAIQECQRRKCAGSIYWGQQSKYFDPSRGGNAHAYLFSNSDFDFSDVPVLRLLNFPFPPGGDNFEPDGDEAPRRTAKRLIDQYAYPRAEILDEVDSFEACNFAGPMLGVHVRRTDVLTGFEGRKAQAASNFVDEAKKWLNENGGSVFLATDDSDTIQLFKSELGNRLVFQDALRSHDGKSLHGHLDQGIAGSPYQKGREALVDAILLSRCQFLIRCFSFLTAYSLCLNPDLQFLDLDMKNLGVRRTAWLHKQ